MGNFPLPLSLAFCNNVAFGITNTLENMLLSRFVRVLFLFEEYITLFSEFSWHHYVPMYI